MVYEFCLVVGRVTPHWQIEDGEENPYVTLLRLSKAIYDEAEPILYRNTFAFLILGPLERLFVKSLPTSTPRLLLKNVEISLQGSDLASEDVNTALMWLSAPPHLLSPPRNAFNINNMRHLLVKACLRNVSWQRKVSPLLQTLKLDRLVLDLRNCNCWGGCCSLHVSAIVAFEKSFFLGAPKALQLNWPEAGIGPKQARIDQIIGDCFKLWTLDRGGCKLVPSRTWAEFGGDL